MRQFASDQKQATAAAYLRTWSAIVCYVPTPGCTSEGTPISIRRVKFRESVPGNGSPAGSGPQWTCFLRQPHVAQQVLASIEYGAQRGDYDLHAWVIMPNHVHLLLTPRVNASKALGSLKAGNAKSANRLLGRAGQAFWQDESYDHLVRNDEEFRRIQRYIESNPVAAGLVLKPEDYVWSSAGRPERPPQAGARPTS